MKVNRQNSITCSLTNAEVRAFEAWGTAMRLNVNQAIKKCIHYTIKRLQPAKPAVEPAKPLEMV
jgi:hypothetical protein